MESKSETSHWQAQIAQFDVSWRPTLLRNPNGWAHWILGEEMDKRHASRMTSEVKLQGWSPGYSLGRRMCKRENRGEERKLKEKKIKGGGSRGSAVSWAWWPSPLIPAEAGRSLQVGGQPGLHSVLQDSQEHVETLPQK